MLPQYNLIEYKLMGGLMLTRGIIWSGGVAFCENARDGYESTVETITLGSYRYPKGLCNNFAKAGSNPVSVWLI